MPLLILGLCSCLRPPRLVATYSQARPRFAQREHVGFSFPHFNLDDPQARQLSRSLGVARVVEWRLVGVAGVGSLKVGEFMAARSRLHWKGGHGGQLC